MNKSKDKRAVFITGASGLLGKSIVSKFLKEGFRVFGHYYKHRPEEIEECEWLYGDFSTLEGLRKFREDYSVILKKCNFLVNNYGPLTYEDTKNITSKDLLHDFHHNVIVSKEITDLLIGIGELISVVNVGFEHAGVFKAYKKILPYAIAKNALLLLTLSYREVYPEISFEMVYPESISGGRYMSESGKFLEKEDVSDQIFSLILKGGKRE
jgi:NAD(P)-dependent dehydrogenase (short-subunit alcohol dehydrogenase family)